MLATDTINFQTVDLLAVTQAEVLRRFEANEVFEKEANAMTSEEMTPIFEAVVTQLTALEVVECIHYSAEEVQREYLVYVHQLTECKMGFEQIGSDDFDWTRYFKFSNSRDAFAMIADFLKF